MKWGVRDPELGETQAQDERTVVSPKSLYSGKNNLKIKNYDGSVWQNEKGEQWRQENDGKQDVGEAPDYKIDLREGHAGSRSTPPSFSSAWMSAWTS